MKKTILSVIAICMTLALNAQHIFMFETNNLTDSIVDVYTDTYVLNTCSDYTLTVDGTYSIWTATHWPNNPCGNPEPSPIYISPGVANNGTVGFDMEYIFAGDEVSGTIACADLNLAATTQRIQISTDGGVNWFHPLPTAATAAFNAVTHSYDYIIPGGGFPLQVRHTSPFNSDDYGQLRFQITENDLPSPCSIVPSFNAVIGKCGVQFYDDTNLPCSQAYQILGTHYDFGDGNTSSVFNPTHVYSSIGTYNVEYTVWITNGEECCEITGSQQVTVTKVAICDPCESVLPNLDFTFFTSGHTASFTQTGITGDWGFGYYWDFGDGNFSTVESPQHTYADNGMYQVCLTLFYLDDEGNCCSQEICKAVLIGSDKNASVQSNFAPQQNEVERLSIFPNPAQDFVTVSLESEEIESVKIIDLTGKTVLSMKNIELNGSLKLDVSNLSSGIYTVLAESRLSKKYTSKIVLK